MAGPFSRLGKKLKQSLLAPAEDPRAKYASAYEKQRQLLAHVREALGGVARAKARLESKASATSRKLPQLEALARQALLDGREDLARLRLQRRHLAQVQLQALQEQLGDIEREEQRLSLTEQRLSDQLAAFFTKQELIAARYDAAEAQVHISEALAGVSVELADLSSAMAAAEQESERMQARVAAIDRLVDEGLLGVPPASTPISVPAAVENSDFDIETELAALRATLPHQSSADRQM